MKEVQFHTQVTFSKTEKDKFLFDFMITSSTTKYRITLKRACNMTNTHNQQPYLIFTIIFTIVLKCNHLGASDEYFIQFC